jgi:hypothetical protein
MLWTAPVVGLLTIPAAIALGVDPASHPEQVAFLSGMGLLGTWGALAPSKLLEGRAIGTGTRRILHLVIGALVGLVGFGLASVTEIGKLPGPNVALDAQKLLDPKIADFIGSFGQPNPLVYAAFFSLLGLLTGSTAMAARDRRRRFGIWPVLKSGALGGLLGLALPFPEPWGIAVAALSAAAIQAVSPWSAPGAAYARYAARIAKKTGRKVA